MGFMGYVIIVIAVVILIFLVCREIVCWYWKINEIKDLLTNIDASLNDIKQKQSLVPANMSAMSDERKLQELPEQKPVVQQESIKSYDDLLNNPQIKEEADTLRRMYGEDACKRFLEKKAKEMGIDPVINFV